MLAQEEEQQWDQEKGEEREKGEEGEEVLRPERYTPCSR